MPVFSPSQLRRAIRPALVVFSILLAIGIVAPFVDAYAFAGPIQSALQNSLGRPVSFKDAHFTLFSGPGFTLTDVSIAEDPRFGLEPFAYVPTLEARLRVSELLRGRIAVASLRLVDPSLNVVRGASGRWNVVELVTRLAAPSRLPIDLFPSFSVANGRIDFKQNSRKSTLYIADADLSLYPERSGKLYIRFSGSPARTDRSGAGLGHLHGTINWYLKPLNSDANQLEADFNLDPSNISELSTLARGEDLGIHGTVSSHARIEGPLNALRVSGELQLTDVHRWDLMPAAGEDWRVPYTGSWNLVDHQVSIKTAPVRGGEAPLVLVEFRANSLTTVPTWTVLASMTGLPASDLLPLSKRLGLPVPDGLHVEGAAEGVVSYSNRDGLSGTVELRDVSAALPQAAALRAASVTATISDAGIHFANTKIESDTSGSIEIGGDYISNGHSLALLFQPVNFSIQAWRGTLADWFGAPDALAFLQDGNVSGRIEYQRRENVDPSWSGQFRFADAVLAPPGLSEPLTSAAGTGRFDNVSLDIDHSTFKLGTTAISASYHLNTQARILERFQAKLEQADFRDMETAFGPLFQDRNWFARLGIGRRKLPEWLTNKRMQGEISVAHAFWNGSPLGALRTTVDWNGPSIAFPDAQLRLPEGIISGRCLLNLSSGVPQYEAVGRVSGYHWNDGLLSAEGHLQTSGFGSSAVDNIKLEGTFSGQDLSFADDEAFSTIRGSFSGDFAKGWPEIRLTEVEASDADQAWTGTGTSQSDGKLVLDLQHAGKQLHLVSDLEPQGDSETESLAGPPGSR